MNPIVSVVVIFRNEEGFIGDCINSVLNQTFKNFELVLINDASTDKSKQIALSFNDKRIRYIENKKQKGFVGARNKGIENSQGSYIFFTDGDCIVQKDWIEQGIKIFERGFKGVEGKTNYFLKNPGVSERVIRQSGGIFGTNNIAYDASFLKELGGFNIRYSHYCEDRELALRVQNTGNGIFYNSHMVCIHQRKKWTVANRIEVSKQRGIKEVFLVKDYGRRANLFGFIVLPKHFLATFIPLFFLVFIYSNYHVKTLYDFWIMIIFYYSLIIQRLCIWKTAISQGVFVI